MADLVIACHERYVALSLKLAEDLAMQRLLVGFHGQEEVGPLLLEELKTGAVCGAHLPESPRLRDLALRGAF
jgi:hypothetical protein